MTRDNEHTRSNLDLPTDLDALKLAFVEACEERDHLRSLLFASPVAQEPVARDWPSIGSAINEYLDGYELIGEPGDHTPTEFERLLIGDAIHGLLADPEFLALLAAPVAAQASSLQQDIETLLTMLGNHEYAEHWAKTDIGKRLESAITALHGELSAAQTQEPAPDLIRIDTILPNGVPDSEYITHDECRQRLAKFADGYRRWIEVQQLVLTAPKPEQS